MTLIRWDLSTWEEIKDLCNSKALVMIPAGSIEQHGPHLPLGTDYLIADALVERVGKEVNLPLIKTPALTYGLSVMWEAYPGTITLTTKTYLQLVRDIVKSVFRAGCKKVIIVNGHAGNSEALRVAGRDIVEEERCGEVAVVTIWELCGDLISDLFQTSFFHADEVESSVALALGLRVKKPLKPGVKIHRKYSEKWHSLNLTLRPKAYVFRSESKEIHGRGSFGRPDLASNKKGEALVECFTKRLTDLAKDFYLGKV